jgi:hypothetical protein
MDTTFFINAADPIWNTLVRFGITLLVIIIIIRFIYFRYTPKERNVFSFFMMGIMIFLVCMLLQHVEIQLGVALGLFAVFAILRFRSDGLTLRDMTYFFTVIGVSVINAMASYYNPVRGTILINCTIILSVYILELFYHKKTYARSVVIYNRLELLDSEKETELIEDLSKQTYKKVEKVEIKKIDLNKSIAELEIFYND